MINRLVGVGVVVSVLVIACSVEAADGYGLGYGYVYQAPAGLLGTGYRPYYPVSYPSVPGQNGSHRFHSNRIAPHTDPYSATRRYATVPAPPRPSGRPPIYLRSFP